MNRTNLKVFLLRRVLQRPVSISLAAADCALPMRAQGFANYPEPGNKICCVLNFDDLCPIPSNSLGQDFGGSPGQGLALRFEQFLNEYPYLGVTQFAIPMAVLNGCKPWRYWHSRNRYDISAPEHSPWLAYWTALGQRFNMEFALHGCCHVQFENPFFARHAEFAFKRRSEAEQAINTGLAAFHRAGWKAVGFRQPGWDLNSDFSLIEVLAEKDFQYVAASSHDAGLNARRTRVSNDFPVRLGNILNFPQNILLDWELDQAKEKIDQIVKCRGLISIKGHFVNQGDSNCLSERNFRLLRSILDYVAAEYGDAVEYVTLQQLAERILAGSHVTCPGELA